MGTRRCRFSMGWPVLWLLKLCAPIPFRPVVVVVDDHLAVHGVGGWVPRNIRRCRTYRGLHVRLIVRCMLILCSPGVFQHCLCREPCDPVAATGIQACTQSRRSSRMFHRSGWWIAVCCCDASGRLRAGSAHCLLLASLLQLERT